MRVDMERMLPGNRREFERERKRASKTAPPTRRATHWGIWGKVPSLEIYPPRSRARLTTSPFERPRQLASRAAWRPSRSRSSTKPSTTTSLPGYGRRRLTHRVPDLERAAMTIPVGVTVNVVNPGGPLRDDSETEDDMA